MEAISKLKNVVKLKDLLGDGLIATGEPQRSYMFEVAIIDTVSGDAFNNLRYYVKEVTIPSRARDSIVVEYMGNKLIWSGKDSSSHEIAITFWDDENLIMTHFLNRWNYLSGEPQHSNGLGKESYVRDIKLIMKPMIDIGTTGTFLFKNCFPTQIGEISLSYDDSSVMEIPTTFSYDYREVIESEGNIIKTASDLIGTGLDTGEAVKNIKGLF
jgi:hypothetical protein